MESMGRRIRHRRLRGLVRHHRRHPSAHPRRLVRRVRSWGERPVNGVCRWCGEHASSIQLTWHGYCLDAYRVASGQKPGMQLTMCEGCAGPADELDHRLAINVARALGDRMRSNEPSRSRTCSGSAARATGTRPGSIAVLHAISGHARWTGEVALRVWRLNRTWAGIFLPTLCSMDAGGDALPLGDVRTAA